MKSKYELILFDLDGTLIEFHNEYLFSETDRIMQKLEREVISREVLEHGFSIFDYFHFLAEHELDSVRESFWAHFDWDNFPQAVPLQPTLGVLNSIKQAGLTQGIVTSRMVPEEQLARELSHTGILDYTCHIRTRPGPHVHWSDKRESILVACQQAGVSPEKAVMVGDIPPDITSAKDVGIGMAVGVLSGGIKQQVLEEAKPDHILEDIGDLLDVLLLK